MRLTIILGVSTAVLSAAAGGAAPTKPASATAHYKVTADTYSGFGAGFMGGRGMGSMLGAMMSGRATDPNASARTLNLELDSDRTPAGEPQAEHLPPAALGVGASLPLLTPRLQRSGPATEPGDPGAMERPKGRLLMFWGCGEKARPGQPLVIDFAKMMPGQLTPQMMAMMRTNPQQMAQMAQSMAARAGRGRGQYATIGLWPNEKTRVTVPSSGSLAGEHVIRGNYSPEIRFTLAPAQDYLAAIRLSHSPLASGATGLSWRPVPNALGYSATAFGGHEETMVIWSSSEVQNSAGPGEFVTDAEAARLVAQRVLLAPSTTQCAVPAEAMQAMGGAGFLTMQAIGPSSAFSYPPRPAKAVAGWEPDWVAQIQTRATNMTMLGSDAAGMLSSGDEDGEANSSQPQPKKKKKSLLDGLIKPF